jgi:hypothetical protein
MGFLSCFIFMYYPGCQPPFLPVTSMHVIGIWTRTFGILFTYFRVKIVDKTTFQFVTISDTEVNLFLHPVLTVMSKYWFGFGCDRYPMQKWIIENVSPFSYRRCVWWCRWMYFRATHSSFQRLSHGTYNGWSFLIASSLCERGSQL